MLSYFIATLFMQEKFWFWTGAPAKAGALQPVQSMIEWNWLAKAIALGKVCIIWNGAQSIGTICLRRKRIKNFAKKY